MTATNIALEVKGIEFAQGVQGQLRVLVAAGMISFTSFQPGVAVPYATSQGTPSLTVVQPEAEAAPYFDSAELEALLAIPPQDDGDYYYEHDETEPS